MKIGEFGLQQPVGYPWLVHILFIYYCNDSIQSETQLHLGLYLAMSLTQSYR